MMGETVERTPTATRPSSNGLVVFDLADRRVAFADAAVRDRVKQAGGTWNPERRVWQLRYDHVVALGLKSRIVDEPAFNSGCPGSSGEHLHADAPAASG